MAKKKIIIAILALSLSIQMGCTNSDKENGGNNLDNGNKVEQNEDAKIDEKKIVTQLNEIVEDNEKLAEAIEFMDKNISKVSKETASQMVEIFEKAQKDYLATIEDKYYNEEIQKKFQGLNKSIEDINKLEGISEEAIKELVKESKSIGYKVETAEAVYFPIIDYSFIEKYSSYVTADMKDYIEIMAVESNQVPAKDAALIITWDELLNRALAQEKFINEYKDSAKLNDVKELYKKYVYFIFNGLNNTPLFDYDSKVMLSDAKESYLTALESKDNSRLLEELRGYMDALKETNYKLTDTIQKHREEAIKRLIEN